MADSDTTGERLKEPSVQQPEVWQEINRQLDTLLDLPEEQRAEQLAVLAATDPQMAKRLTRMLAGINHSAPLEQLASLPLVQEALQTLDGIGPGDVLSGWTLHRRIGAGGMAEVFEARRVVAGVEQRAALKLMAMGLASEEQKRRFRQETAILARLQDPRLSRLIDAGTAADGRPWLAMEYIEGDPIDRACERDGLGLRARVALLLEVARAVDVCHRALVVHRDLKPSNVLVTTGGEVRLLDFGIAKVMEPAAANPLATAFAVAAYTLSYSSPEQLQSRPSGVECDVYQLGLLLYQLLTGRLPFDSIAREPVGLLRAMENGPALPSHAAAGSNQSSGNRAGSWARRLHGDLDAIALRALEFKAEKRYASARDLADDLQNWLDGRPVSARPQTLGYRTRRYLRRHWLGAGASVLISLLVLGYALTVTWQAQRLTEQRNAAEAARLRADSIRGFLLQVFGSVDPQSQASRGKSIEQLLIEGVDRARSEFTDQPILAAQLLVDMADVLARRGRLDVAQLAYEDAKQLRSETLGPDHPEVHALSIPLGDVLYHQGEGEAALKLLRQALLDAERLFGRDSKEVIAVLAILGPVESVYGELDASEQQLRRALELQERLFPPATAEAEHVLQLAVLENQLGVMLMRAKRFEEAISVQQKSVAHYAQEAGQSDSRTLAATKNLAFAYRMTEQPGEARKLFEQVLANERALYAAPHWQIAYSLGHLANLAADEEDYERALSLWEEAEEVTRAAMGEEYYWLANARVGRASVLLQLGRKQEGLAILKDFLESVESNPPMVRRAQELLQQYGQ